MFADTELARRIDAAEADLTAGMARAAAARQPDAVFATPLRGGYAVFTGVDAPPTKIIGVGFDGVPDARELDAIEAAYAARRSGVRAEVSTLADPTFGTRLTERGYMLFGFENVLGRPVTAADADPADIAGVDVRMAADPRAWMDVVILGFAHPDGGVPSAPGESFPRETLELAYTDMAATGGFFQYAAFAEDEIAGGASMRLFDGIAQLCGAATAPRFRRRGIQTALFRTRLRDAARAGCTLAVITTQPGSKSQQNAHRIGFSLLYARAVLVKGAPEQG
jgi:ribosomal protein S18 acetylase RimI-like enzyme